MNRRQVEGFNNRMSKRILHKKETIQSRLWKIVIQRFTVVEFRVNSWRGDGKGCYTSTYGEEAYIAHEWVPQWPPPFFDAPAQGDPVRIFLWNLFRETDRQTHERNCYSIGLRATAYMLSRVKNAAGFECVRLQLMEEHGLSQRPFISAPGSMSVCQCRCTCVYPCSVRWLTLYADAITTS